MITVYYSIEGQTVTVNNETCSFTEAGLHGQTDRDVIEEHLADRHNKDGEIEVEVICEDRGSLNNELFKEIKRYNANEPDVTMFVDENGNIFWVSENEYYVWMMQDKSYQNYLDKDHVEIEQNSPEGVANKGVYWKNTEFETPFHITDFLEKINTITV